MSLRADASVGGPSHLSEQPAPSGLPGPADPTAGLGDPPGRDPAEVAAAVRAVLAAPALADVPLPGGGRTAERWALLRALARWDVATGRLVEAHLDAAAILAGLGAGAVRPGEVWAVWAAEPPGQAVTATSGPDGWTLRGRKPWCSGADASTHALVTATADDGRRLFAVPLADRDRTRPVPGGWAAAGMSQTQTWSVDLDDAPAVPVGGPRAYLDRAGFWHGGVGVAACWLGGADAVLAPLERRAASGRLDPHGLAHLGAAAAAVHAAGAVLGSAAATVDAAPDDAAAELVARRARAVVEHAASTVLDRVGRALGAAPLCLDVGHARRVEDLTVYLRQSHAERDLEVLGSLVGSAVAGAGAGS
jgi:alkylation response protein AidB-like acyl-CoA dehydrogenase